ncbi:MAG: sigma-70 family RNA polymerase sigma factor [Planctomycetaceae bacterium]|nr:sigma-70 family RNA polymerase sigma factor [Planctomycetaceae bacterium]
MSATATGTMLGWYLERIKDTPLLTAQQERDLARRVRDESDAYAREEMIQANLRLVINIAKEYSSPGMTLADLVAEGNLGLLRAVEDFDPDAGVRFSTYAAWWIKQSIKRALINAGQPIHIPAYLAKLISKWRRTSRRLEASFGRQPTLEEMAATLRISSRKAQIVQQGLTAVTTPGQSAGDESQTLAEMLPDTRVESPDQSLLDSSNAPLVKSLLARLDARERRILELRFGLGKSEESPQLTYKEIGRLIGLTRERVRQLERQALQRLRALAQEVI